MADKIRYPRLFQAFSWTLLVIGLFLLIPATLNSPPKSWFPLLVFIPLCLIADRFAIPMAADVYLSLQTTFHLASMLLYGPILTAWVAWIEAFISEIMIFRRKAAFAARTAGMYILMWLIGGATYNAVGGTVPLTRLDAHSLLNAFLLFLAATAVNYGIMAVDSLTRGTPFALFAFQVSPRIVLYKAAFAPFGIVGAVIAINTGIVAALIIAFIFLLGLAAVWRLRSVSEQLTYRITMLNLVQEVGQIIGSSLELEPMLELIHQGISRLMEAENFWIALYDPERNEVEYALLYDEGKRYPPDRCPYDPNRYLASYIIQRGQPVFLSTLEEVKQVPISTETAGSGRLPESLIAVPIISKGRVIGAISVQSYEPRAFRSEDAETLMTLANQAGIALENARLFQEVESSQRYLRTVLDSVDYAVVVTDLEGRIRLANRAMEDLFGFHEREVINRPLSEVMKHQSLIAIAERLCHQEVLGRESLQVTLSDQRIMTTHIAPLFNIRGERIGYVVAMADVTPLYRLSELKSQIIRIASHDLRNPLQLAGGFFQILLDELPPLTEMQAELARRVQHHLRAMERLIDELLELERIEIPESRRKELLDPLSLVQQAMSEYRWQAEMKGLHLWTSVARDLPPIWGDRRMLLQAISNLLDNAIKYTPGGGTITVSVWEEDDKIKITVRDTGVGIPPESIPYLFKHFYRARQPGTEQISGTGLGLSLVQSIIQEHGGRVWVESEGIGKGSLFGIALPVFKGTHSTASSDDLPVDDQVPSPGDSV